MTKFNKCNFRQKHKNTCYYIMNINLKDRCHKNHIYENLDSVLMESLSVQVLNPRKNPLIKLSIYQKKLKLLLPSFLLLYEQFFTVYVICLSRETNMYNLSHMYNSTPIITYVYTCTNVYFDTYVQLYTLAHIHTCKLPNLCFLMQLNFIIFLNNFFIITFNTNNITLYFIFILL